MVKVTHQMCAWTREGRARPPHTAVVQLKLKIKVAPILAVFGLTSSVLASESLSPAPLVCGSLARTIHTPQGLVLSYIPGLAFCFL